jgi:hypothetical protein
VFSLHNWNDSKRIVLPRSFHSLMPSIWNPSSNVSPAGHVPMTCTGLTTILSIAFLPHELKQDVASGTCAGVWTGDMDRADHELESPHVGYDRGKGHAARPVVAPRNEVDPLQVECVSRLKPGVADAANGGHSYLGWRWHRLPSL